MGEIDPISPSPPVGKPAGKPDREVGGGGRRAAPVVAVILLLGIFAITARTASLQKTATFDEPTALLGAYAQARFADFRWNPEDPPLWKFIAVLGTGASDLKIDTDSPWWNQMPRNMDAQSHMAMESLYRTSGIDPDLLLNRAHLRMIGVGILLGIVIAWWAWRLGGPIAGVVAVAFYALDPNFLAHSALVKNDVAISLAFLGLMAAVWMWGERATAWRIIAVGIMLAVALTTKFSGVLGIAMIAVALLIRVLLPTPQPFFRWMARMRSQKFAVAAGTFLLANLIGWAGIWAAYDFRYSIGPDPTHSADDAAYILQFTEEHEAIHAHGSPRNVPDAKLKQWVSDRRPSLLDRLLGTAMRDHLLPEGWCFGFLYTYATTLYRGTFLLGKYSQTGWWYYFPLAMLMKTPTATILALAAALAGWIWRTALGFSGLLRSWPFWAAVVAPIIYAGVAMHSHVNLGLRHIFPVYPFLFIALGLTSAAAMKLRRRSTIIATAALFAGLAVETFAAWPDFIPFFNVISSRWLDGPQLLSDSNVSWGQDLGLLGKWQKAHPDKTVYLLYFGSADPKYYGIRYYRTPMESTLPDMTTVPPGAVQAIDATTLQGVYATAADRRKLDALRNRKPIAVLGGSIYLFD